MSGRKKTPDLGRSLIKHETCCGFSQLAFPAGSGSRVSTSIEVASGNFRSERPLNSKIFVTRMLKQGPKFCKPYRLTKPMRNRPTHHAIAAFLADFASTARDAGLRLLLEGWLWPQEFFCLYCFLQMALKARTWVYLRN